MDFWFNTVTGEVEEGRVSDWSVVMGPYPTREAAALALDTARARSHAWDEADRAWREGREGEDDEDGGGSSGAGRSSDDGRSSDAGRSSDGGPGQ